jgi:SAM-dependent methyltransferase
MREPFNHQYDSIFNLFTSFGYFEDDKEDLLILQNIKNGLKKDGFFVFDFLNAALVKENLVAKETKIVDDITFHITRKIENGFIIKNISFFADNKQHSYTERVKYLDETKMKSYFEKVGFTITNTFGDYKLSNFNEKTSNRLILVAK